MSEGAPDGVGTVIDDGGQFALRFVRTFPCSAEDLWDALTSTDRTRAWAFPATFRGGAGGTVRFDFGEATFTEGSIIAWDPPVLLEYQYGDPGEQWHLRMRVRAADHESELTFDHLTPDPTVPEFAAGWHWHLDRLAQHLAGQTPAQVPSDEAFEALLGFYVSR